MHSSTAILFIFSKIMAFLYLSSQLVILPLQAFSMALQFRHLFCLVLLFPLYPNANEGIDLLVIGSSNWLTLRPPRTNQM